MWQDASNSLNVYLSKIIECVNSTNLTWYYEKCRGNFVKKKEKRKKREKRVLQHLQIKMSE